MPEILKTALPASIALIGTLLVVVMGYRQWKKQQEVVRYGSFLSDRQSAYRQLWEKLEAVHLYVRSESFEKQAFHELVRPTNSHMISAGLHLKDGEKERVNRYLMALESLGQCMADDRASSTREEARETLRATRELPNEVLGAVQGLQRAYSRVEVERTEVISHFREILGARYFD